jgi:hypothetical protein
MELHRVAYKGRENERRGERGEKRRGNMTAEDEEGWEVKPACEGPCRRWTCARSAWYEPSEEQSKETVSRSGVIHDQPEEPRGTKNVAHTPHMTYGQW